MKISSSISLICAVIALVFTATQTGAMPSPSDEASLLLTALCIHDNRIRESCLHNARTKEFINGLIMSLSSPARINDASDSDNGQKVAAPEKRRREQDQLSGFYSNW